MPTLRLKYLQFLTEVSPLKAFKIEGSSTHATLIYTKTHSKNGSIDDFIMKAIIWNGME